MDEYLKHIKKKKTSEIWLDKVIWDLIKPHIKFKDCLKLMLLDFCQHFCWMMPSWACILFSSGEVKEPFLV